MHIKINPRQVLDKWQHDGDMYDKSAVVKVTKKVGQAMLQRSRRNLPLFVEVEYSDTQGAEEPTTLEDAPEDDIPTTDEEE